MSVKNFYREIESMKENEVFDYLDAIANDMKQRVVNSESDYYAGGRIIYVSAQGDDNNDGISTSTPICSLNKLSEILEDGDTVLFRRGDMFRGNIEIKKAGITLSAYGEGKKPIINSSLKNYADEKLWEKTQWENVWVCKDILNNVGIIHYDTTGEYGNYSEKTGFMLVLGKTQDFNGPMDMKEEYTFYSDLESGLLYVYSYDNPGRVHSSIEIGTRINTIRGTSSHLTVDNLHIQHCGAHGVADRGKHLTVKNCIFDWIGGSILSGFCGCNTIRYGNAVEVGACDGYLVSNNWMYQIYDTGITHQAGPSAIGDVHQYDAMYLDNLVEYCFWSLEFYNAQVEGYMHDIRNIYITGNFCRFGGFGWGCKGRESYAPMVSSAYCCPDVRDFRIENNIFDRCSGYIITMKNDEGNKRIEYRSNAYIQMKDNLFIRAFDNDYRFDSNVRATICEILGDKTATIYTIENWAVQPQFSGKR